MGRSPVNAKPPDSSLVDEPAFVLSVIICTYNRADLLEIVLDSLSRQRLAPELWEAIVVDNNSRDRTPHVAADYSTRISNLRYVTESAQGLSHARNRGLAVARGEFVGYIDDDCKLPDGWLARAERIASEEHPAVFGGPFDAFYLTPKPDWYRDAWGSYDLGPVARNLDSNEYFYGGHIFFDRRLLRRQGGFDGRLGMAGDKLGYGEEIVPQQQIRAETPTALFHYDPELRVWHLVRSEKLSLRWIVKDAFVRAGYVQRVFCPDPRPRRRLGILREAGQVVGGLLLDALRGIVTRDRTRWPYLRQYWAESTLRYVRWLGTLRESWRQAAVRQARRADRS